MKRISFYARAAELLSSGEEFTVVDLLETRGSVPQEERAKLIVHPDGRTEGTLGGGDLEARAIADALRLERGEVKVVDYDLAALGMVCGGAVKLLYHHMLPHPDEERFYREAARRTAAGNPVAIALAVLADKRAVPRLLIAETGVAAEVDGAFPGRDGAITAANELLTPSSTTDCTVAPGPGATAYIERLVPQPRLLIFGAGHIGAALARVVHTLDLFHVEVTDDRDSSLQTLAEDGVMTHNLAPGFTGALPTIDHRTYIVIVTRSHATDFTVLQHVLRRDALPKYIGVIGSRNKKREVFARLRAAGVANERIARVTMPIGLRIGGKSPSEIAVSILAQLVRVKNGLETGNDDW